MPSRNGKPTSRVAARDDPAATAQDGIDEDLPAQDGPAEDLLEAVTDALVGVDHQGLIRFVNRRTEALFGYERGALVGSPLEALVPGSLPAVRQAHRDGDVAGPQAQAAGNGLELVGLRRDGSEFLVDIALSHVDTAGDPLVIVSARDMTGYLEVEGSHNLLARMAAIIANSDDAIVGKTLDGIITSWNTAAERMYGYSSAEIIGESVAVLIPEGRTGESDAILAMIRAGQPFEHFSTIRLRKDGSVFPVSLTISPIRDARGMVIGASATSHDLTRQQEAFAATQRVAAIVENSDDAIIGRTLDGIITNWNPAAERMYGYTSAEIVGRSSDILSPVDRTGEIKNFLSRIKAGQLVEHLETNRVRKDGTVFPVSLTISPIRDAGGVIVGASTIARDVTEAKLAQLEIAEQRAAALVRLAQLDRANADLKAVNTAMQGFIDVAAHNLRTPLSAVLGYSDLLAEGWATLGDERKQKFADTINRQSHNLAGLVDDLLTLSSIEGGAIGPRPKAVALDEAINGCLQERGVSTTTVPVSCPPDLVAWVDPTHLVRIIDNYLQNALTYGAAPVRIDVARRDDAIEIRVLDHGPGVPTEFVPRLFEKFAQADSWGTRGRGGAGLGLSMVRGLARVNGGHALYEPNAAGGACFIVRLPPDATLVGAVGG